MSTIIKSICFTDHAIITTTSDGKRYSRSLADFPRLNNASNAQRNQYTIGMFGDDVRWKDIDEDIHFSSLTRTLYT